MISYRVPVRAHLPGTVPQCCTTATAFWAADLSDRTWNFLKSLRSILQGFIDNQQLGYAILCVLIPVITVNTQKAVSA